MGHIYASKQAIDLRGGISIGYNYIPENSIGCKSETSSNSDMRHLGVICTIKTLRLNQTLFKGRLKIFWNPGNLLEVNKGKERREGR